MELGGVFESPVEPSQLLRHHDEEVLERTLWKLLRPILDMAGDAGNYCISYVCFEQLHLPSSFRKYVSYRVFRPQGTVWYIPKVG